MQVLLNHSTTTFAAFIVLAWIFWSLYITAEDWWIGTQRTFSERLGSLSKSFAFVFTCAYITKARIEVDFYIIHFMYFVGNGVIIAYWILYWNGNLFYVIPALVSFLCGVILLYIHGVVYREREMAERTGIAGTEAEVRILVRNESCRHLGVGEK